MEIEVDSAQKEKGRGKKGDVTLFGICERKEKKLSILTYFTIIQLHKIRR